MLKSIHDFIFEYINDIAGVIISSRPNEYINIYTLIENKSIPFYKYRNPSLPRTLIIKIIESYDSSNFNKSQLIELLTYPYWLNLLFK